MGNKFSAIHGVKSGNFYNQGNAINEIWIGDVEIVSRLPFGDSDLGQAGWPEGSWPKIPWHQFIIPMKRSLDTINNTIMATNETAWTCPKATDFVWPNTGFFSYYKLIPQRAAFLTSTLLLGIALGLLFLPTHTAEWIHRVLSFYQRLRVRVSPSGCVVSEIKYYYWHWAVFMFASMVIGLIIFVLALPLVLYGMPGMNVFGFFVEFTMSAFILSGCSSLYQFFRLFMVFRRALAVHRQSPSANEKSTEDDILVVTPEEYQQRREFIRICPYCERTCLRET